MRRPLVLLAALTLAAALAACSSDDGGGSGAPSSSTTSTTSTTSAAPSASPASLPSQPPPSGELRADVEQSSRDSAAGQFQVWVDNDTASAIDPTRVTYRDGRFRTALRGSRLREIPSQSRRGFPFRIPGRPACGSDATRGTVTVAYVEDGVRRSLSARVDDEADVVERVTSARCLELAVARIADLRLADEVTADGDGGEGSVGTMTLVVEPTGRPGPTLVIDTIVGNPVLSPGDHGVYQADLTVRGDAEPQEVPIPIRPTRCDAHAFGESGSFGQFMANVHLDGRAGQFLLVLSPAGAAAAVDYAKASCGFLTTISGSSG